jgi:purine nucleoside phosphorylase
MSAMPSSDFLLLLAVLLPPHALSTLGEFVEERSVQTPYGEVGPLARRVSASGHNIWIAPYTGLPDRTDPRATLHAARELGVGRILGWELGVAVNPLLGPGQRVIAQDYVDWSHQPVHTFASSRQIDFDAEALALRPAFCPQMSQSLQAALPDAPEAVYLATEGPRRETAAEARIYRSWGIDVLGQNLAPEVSLAQELGLCFAGLITVGAVAADRPQPPHRGEIRASLHATLDALPAWIEALSGPLTCSCARHI